MFDVFEKQLELILKTAEDLPPEMKSMLRGQCLIHLDAITEWIGLEAESFEHQIGDVISIQGDE